MSIRVLVAEDYRSMRLALRGFLERRADMEIVEEAVDGQEAVQLCLRLRPDVVTMDVHMPGVNGIQATGQISRLLPQVAVLAISSETELWGVQQMFAAGASGYILKDFLYEDLEVAVRTLACGGAFLGHAVIDRVLAHATNHKNPLAQKETAVLRALARGRSREQIALDLHLTPNTLRQVLRRVGQKAGMAAIERLVNAGETE